MIQTLFIICLFVRHNIFVISKWDKNKIDKFWPIYNWKCVYVSSSGIWACFSVGFSATLLKRYLLCFTVEAVLKRASNLSPCLPLAPWTSASCCRRSDTWGCSWRGASRPTQLCGKNWRSSCCEDPTALRLSTLTTCCRLQVNARQNHVCWGHLMHKYLCWRFTFIPDEGGRSPGREGGDPLHHSFQSHHVHTSILHGETTCSALIRCIIISSYDYLKASRHAWMFSDVKHCTQSEVDGDSVCSSSCDSASAAPSRLVPGHRMWANRNGRHVLGLIEDYNALRKQISEGRKVSRSMDAQLQECLLTLRQQSSDHEVLKAPLV